MPGTAEAVPVLLDRGEAGQLGCLDAHRELRDQHALACLVLDLDDDISPVVIRQDLPCQLREPAGSLLSGSLDTLQLHAGLVRREAHAIMAVEVVTGHGR